MFQIFNLKTNICKKCTK